MLFVCLFDCLLSVLQCVTIKEWAAYFLERNKSIRQHLIFNNKCQRTTINTKAHIFFSFLHLNDTTTSNHITVITLSYPLKIHNCVPIVMGSIYPVLVIWFKQQIHHDESIISNNIYSKTFTGYSIYICTSEGQLKEKI